MKTAHNVKKTIGTATIACVLTLSQVEAALIAHFKLDEGAVDPSAFTVTSSVGDWTGELITETSLPPTWITTSLAQVPSGTTAAVEFDASDPGNDPRIATTCPGVTGNGARTVAAWIKGDLTQPNNGVIVSWGRNVTSGRYTFRVETATGANTGKLRLEVQGHAMVGEAVVMDGKWHHVAVVTPQGATAHSSTLYVDGVAQARTLFGTAATIDTQVDPSVPSELVHIGNGGWSLGVYGLKGQVDDVRIYDEALSQPQILELAAGAGTPPTISQPITDQTIVLGDPTAAATFTVGAGGSPPLSYQWKRGGTVIEGQTEATLRIQPAGPADAGEYSVTVSNGAGQATSTANLRVGTTPVELNQQVGLVGGTSSFSVTMPNVTGYAYQWQLNNVDLPGKTGPTLTLNNLQTADAGNYTVRVTLGTDSATSAPAVLKVLPVPSSAYAAAVLRDGPAAYWRFSETGTATTAVDTAGFQDLTYFGMTGTELGQPGALKSDTDTAVGFSPFTLSFAERALTPELNDVRAFTLEAWVKPEYFGAYRLIDASFTLPTRGYRLELLASGALRFRTAASPNPSGETWTDLTGGMAIEGDWTYVVGTYDGTTKRLYVNGVLVGEQAVEVWPSLGLVFRVGAGNGPQTSPGAILDGGIDEVAFYRKALSPQAVADHYRASGRVIEGVLAAAVNGNNLVISWEGEGWFLESTDMLTGTWQPVPNATSPHSAAMTGNARYYRLSKP